MSERAWLDFVVRLTLRHTVDMHWRDGFQHVYIWMASTDGHRLQTWIEHARTKDVIFLSFATPASYSG